MCIYIYIYVCIYTCVPLVSCVDMLRPFAPRLSEDLIHQLWDACVDVILQE